MKMKLVTAMVLALGLGFVNPALSQNYVKDEAGIFSPSAIKEAETGMARIRKLSGREYHVQTTPELGSRTIDAEAVSRFDNQGIQGILVLISMNPRKIAVRVGDQTGKIFDGDEEAALRKGMGTDLKAGNPDAALTNSVTYVSKRLITRTAETAPPAAPVAPRSEPRIAVAPPAPVVPQEPGQPLRTLGLWLAILAALALFTKWALNRYSDAQRLARKNARPAGTYVGSTSSIGGDSGSIKETVTPPVSTKTPTDLPPVAKVKSSSPPPPPAAPKATRSTSTEDELKREKRRREEAEDSARRARIREEDARQRERNSRYDNNNSFGSPIFIPTGGTTIVNNNNNNNDDDDKPTRSYGRDSSSDSASSGRSSGYGSTSDKADKVDTSSSGSSSDWGSSSSSKSDDSSSSSYGSGSSSSSSSYDSGSSSSSSYDSGSSSSSDSSSSGGSSDF